METDERSDFNSFTSSDPNHPFNSFCYVRIISMMHHLHPDFIIHFAKMFWPDFKIIDDLVYLADNHALTYWDEMKENNYTTAERQFYWNLVEITGIFEELSNEEAMSFAETLAKCWNAKMVADFGEVPTPARAFFEEEYDEVYVTIGSAT